MPEIGTPGLMSGDGKRGDGQRPQATAPILDSTNSDIGPDQHLRPAVRISHSPAMPSSILHTTIGPHEGHMRRRDFSTLLGGGLRRALPARVAFAPAEQSEERRHNA